MGEFIQACLAPFNVLWTVLLIGLLLYWITVILGAIDIDALDVDLDVDADADLDTDLDIAGGESAGVGLSLLRFFNLGDVPLMIVVSVAVLVMWVASVASYPYLGNWSLLAQIPVAIGMFFSSLVAAKIVTQPLKILFRKMREEERRNSNLQIVGMRCRVTSLHANHTYGQVEIPTDGAPLLLNVRTSAPDITLNKGDEAVVVSRQENTDVYLIRAFSLETES